MARKQVKAKKLAGRAEKIAALAKSTETFLAKARKSVVPKLVAWYRDRPAAKAAGDDKPTPPDDAWLIAWASLVPVYQEALNQAGQSAGTAALEQVGGAVHNPISEQLAGRATFPGPAGPLEIPDDVAVDLEGANAGDYITAQSAYYAQYRSAQMVGMTYNADGVLVPTENADLAISDSTRTFLQQDIDDAIEQGLDADQLADLLEANYAFSADRAEAIAQYELDVAHMGATLAGWTAAGNVVGKRSEVSPDHFDDDICDDNEAAGIIPLASPFPSGDYGYPFHLSCECDVYAVYDDGSEEAA